MHRALNRFPIRIPDRLPNLYASVTPTVLRRFTTPSLRNRDSVDEETLSDYDPARYFRIVPGSTIGRSYTAKVKLGYGRTSTTWLCKDHEYVPPELSTTPRCQYCTHPQQKRLQSLESRRSRLNTQREEDIRKDQISRSTLRALRQRLCATTRTHLRF